MKNSFCFWGCLNIQCGSVTGCWAAGLAVALPLGVSEVQAENSSSHPWSNKIIEKFDLDFFFFVFNKEFSVYRSIHTAEFDNFFLLGLTGAVVMKIFGSEGKHLSVFACVCTHTHIILKTELTDTPMRSCLQAEFLTLYFAYKTKSRGLCYRGKRFEYLTFPHPYMLAHTQSQGRKSHCFLSRSIFHPCKTSVIYFPCNWNSRC